MKERRRKTQSSPCSIQCDTPPSFQAAPCPILITIDRRKANPSPCSLLCSAAPPAPRRRCLHQYPDQGVTVLDPRHPQPVAAKSLIIAGVVPSHTATSLAAAITTP
ncbi:hypothetical protein M0R45_020614 [Rubus argutus]|uniref:Uncharacterized protein n=1 Tax=Rubus argutus TaxID=59490 RepID=A0AAW1XB68_RUBAR